LEETAAFYQFQLHRHPEAIRYLEQRGLHDPALIEEMGIGYAPGGTCGGIPPPRATRSICYSTAA